MKDVNKLKVNNFIILNQEIYQILETSHNKTARRGAVVKLKLKNITNNSTSLHTVRANDDIELVRVDKISASYIYETGEEIVFWNNKTCNEIHAPNNLLNDRQKLFLIDGQPTELWFYDENVIFINFPEVVEIIVTETVDNAPKGNSVSGPVKQAILENDYECQVPLFIKVGDKIKFNIATNKFVERVVEKK